jgi:hypothetical protein
MAGDLRHALLLFGGLAALFVWSVWAGLAGVAILGGWTLWLVARDGSCKRALQRRCEAQIRQVLDGRCLEAVFHSHLGVNAIGIAGKDLFVCASPDEAERLPAASVLEGRVQKLPQGDYEIGICVPGRVSGKPYWHTLIVRRRSEAVHWAETVQPILGARLPFADLA